MSRPIARVTFIVLISLALIAATSFSVRGWLGGTSKTTGVHVVGGVQTNFNHQRSTTSELESLRLQGGTDSQPASGSGEGGCRSEGQVSPLD